jgi:hypothetical protein
MYGGVKVLLKLLKMSVIYKGQYVVPCDERQYCGFFCFEEQVLHGTALNNIPAGTAFQVNGAPPHISHCIHTSLDREFPDCWIGRKTPFPCPPIFSRLYSYRFLRVCKRYCSLRKGAKC